VVTPESAATARTANVIGSQVSHFAQGALRLTFTQVILVLLGGTLAVALLIAGLVYAGGSRRSRRYRPGRPFTFTPVWFLSAPEHQAQTGRIAITAGTPAPEPASHHGETGGASDRW
jgi:hypothetical protein